MKIIAAIVSFLIISISGWCDNYWDSNTDYNTSTGDQTFSHSYGDRYNRVGTSWNSRSGEMRHTTSYNGGSRSTVIRQPDSYWEELKSN